LHNPERLWPTPPPDKQPKSAQQLLLGEPEQAADPGPAENPAKANKLTAIATELLAELSAARKRVKPGVRDVKPSAPALADILARLRDKPPITPDELRHVIAVAEAEARRDGSLRWLNPATPFRKGNIARYLAADIDDAARPAARAGPWRPDPTAGSNNRSLDERAKEAKEWMNQ
jgi:hypothetical protein